MRENPVASTDFEIFWREYPRRVGKLKAVKIWAKLRNCERHSAIEGVKLWKQTAQWQSSGGVFIPYASTFLAQKRYLDEPWTGAFAELESKRLHERGGERE